MTDKVSPPKSSTAQPTSSSAPRGVENPLQHMAEIMEQALDIALDKKDVRRKRARRLEREAQRSGKTPSKKPRPGEIFGQEQKATSRYIPSDVRERVHERASYQCEYRALGSRSSKRKSMPLGEGPRRTAGPTHRSQRPPASPEP